MTMSVIRIAVYDGEGRPMGDIHVPLEGVYAWLAACEGKDPEALVDVRDLVDPEHENSSYDWDLSAKPAEVAKDLDSLQP